LLVFDCFFLVGVSLPGYQFLELDFDLSDFKDVPYFEGIGFSLLNDSP
jgi:hypothetical protein